MKRLGCNQDSSEEGYGSVAEDLKNTRSIFTGSDVKLDVDYETQPDDSAAKN